MTALAQQPPAPARPRPFDHQQGFQLLTLLRRVAAEADGTDLEAGRYAISCDLLNSINDVLFEIESGGGQSCSKTIERQGP
jgi:hypothetical protein